MKRPFSPGAVLTTSSGQAQHDRPVEDLFPVSRPPKAVDRSFFRAPPWFSPQLV